MEHLDWEASVESVATIELANLSDATIWLIELDVEPLHEHFLGRSNARLAKEVLFASGELSPGACPCPRRDCAGLGDLAGPLRLRPEFVVGCSGAVRAHGCTHSRRERARQSGR